MFRARARAGLVAVGPLALGTVVLVAVFIAGVDVVETSFLLLVTARRPAERREGA